MDEKFENGKKSFQDCVSSWPPELLYTRRELNYRGDGGNYTDTIASILLGKFIRIQEIQERPRPSAKSYKCRHYGQSGSKIPCQYHERQVARALFNHSQKEVGLRLDPEGCIGKIFDYEVPLKSRKGKDDPSGKIDLLSFNRSSDAIQLVELKIRHKKNSSDETLLRAVTEIFTYFKLLGKERFFRDYGLRRIPFQLVVLSEAQSLSGEQMKMLKELPNLLNLIQRMAQNVGRPIILASFKLEAVEQLGTKDRIITQNKHPFFDPRLLPISFREIGEVGAIG